jgi:leader peptidase (prepilin peptidase)/N-methyltransferase
MAAITPLMVATVVVAWLTWENVRSLRLRNRFTWGGAGAVLLVIALAAVAEDDVSLLLHGLLGAAAIFALGFTVEFISPGLIGFGTVKASVMIGAAAGAASLASWIVAVITLLAGLALTAILAWRIPDRRRLPTGPSLAIAVAAALLVAV